MSNKGNDIINYESEKMSENNEKGKEFDQVNKNLF